MYHITLPSQDPFVAVQKVWSIYTQSFPACERRSMDDYARLCAEEPRFVPASLEVQSQTVGLLWYWQGDDFVYLEHFALDARARNQGWGSQFLRFFTQQNARIILEVEPPTTSITRRRIAFYQRHNFVLSPIGFVNPGYGPIDTPYDLRLMTYPEWSENACKRFLVFLFQSILKKEFRGFH